MTKMRAVQIARANGSFALVERDMPEPRAGEVRVRVQACGVCHSDSLAKEGLYPGIPYPIVPGHEIAGAIDAVGASVPKQLAIGRRVGVGWFGGHCGYCEPCRSRCDPAHRRTRTSSRVPTRSSTPSGTRRNHSS